MKQDALIRHIFAITLNEEHADAAANPPVLWLSSVALVRTRPFDCLSFQCLEAVMGNFAIITDVEYSYLRNHLPTGTA